MDTGKYGKFIGAKIRSCISNIGQPSVEQINVFALKPCGRPQKQGNGDSIPMVRMSTSKEYSPTQGLEYLKIPANLVSTVTSPIHTLALQNNLRCVASHGYSYFICEETEAKNGEWQLLLKDSSKVVKTANG